MEYELIVACVTAAIAGAVLAYVLIKALIPVEEDSLNGEARPRSGIRALLGGPAAFIARRRTLDHELSLKLDEFDRLRVQAGYRFLEGATAAEIFAARFVLPVLAIVFFAVFGSILGLPVFLVVVLAAFFAILLYAWPESGLRAAAQERTLLFVRDLPMALDVMRLVCQSGGDLLSAVKSVLEVVRQSPVREELSRAIYEVAIGTSLAKALANIGERIGTADANAVFSTLSQSLEMGTSVTDNLKNASELIRHTQRIKAQAKAQKAVVAMTFPLLLLILPGVFIVLFAPLLIQYLNR